jgi:hypothetical protein
MAKSYTFPDEETRRIADAVRHSERLRRSGTPRRQRYPKPTDGGGGIQQVAVVGIGNLDDKEITCLVLDDDDDGNLVVPDDATPEVFKIWHPGTAEDFFDDVWQGGEFSDDVVVHPAYQVGRFWKVFPFRFLATEPFPENEEFSDCGRLYSE